MTALGAVSPRVQFIHGLESSPQGDKARFFAEHFTALTPAMDTTDFEGCVRLHARTLGEFSPDVLVGSSFGGAVALELIARGAWRGPTLLLAPAIGHWGGMPRAPAGQRIVIVHGTADDVVPVDVSRAFAAQNPASVQLVEIDDGHRLVSLVRSGRLADYVRELHRSTSGP